MKFLSTGLLLSIALGLISKLHAQSVSNDCTDFEVDSVGVLTLHKSKIAGVARSHSMTGLADYVRIVPPQSTLRPEFDQVQRIILMADVRQLLAPECVSVVDSKEPLVSCAQSIGSYRLKLIVRFNGDNPDNYRALMPSLLSYVTREVLCPQSSKDAIRL